jgi:methionyl aminopeptidase
VELKSATEIATMREAGRVVANVLAALREAAKPGATTAQLDELAAELTRRAGAKPSFRGYRGYPAALCASINEEVVHGIPSRKRQLREGDIVGLDFGVFLDGFHGDAAITVPVGRVGEEARRLVEVTQRCLELAVDQARLGNRLHDIGAAIQAHAEANGFSVVRDFVGHGIGRRLHEDPQVPNYGPAGEGIRLRAGMVLAIEPMVNAGTWEVRVLDDDWTAVTADGKLSAHFEHTVAVTQEGPQILTLP